MDGVCPDLQDRNPGIRDVGTLDIADLGTVGFRGGIVALVHLRGPN